MADLNEYRRGPLNSDRDFQIAIEEIVDKLNATIRASNVLGNRQLVFADIHETPSTLAGYGILDAAPLEHTHPISDVVGLEDALADAAGSGSGGGSTAWTSITGKPATFPPSDHTHDDRYYKKAQTDTLLAGKADVSHNHDSRYYTKAQSDTQIQGKVNRLGGDSMVGYALNPEVLGYDMSVPEGTRMNVFGGILDVAATLDVGGTLEIYE